MVELAWLIPALPLAGFLLLLLFGKRLGEPGAGWLATAMVGGSFLVSVIVFLGLRHEPENTFNQTLWSWLPVGDLSVDVGLLVDPLSMAMTLFITGVAALIHLYSIGYMHGDRRFHQFFLYLNLFVFSMLVLVLADNLLLTFVGWEGVGVCSYFLISFWFDKDANATAGKKAFITNRIGDWGFMVAMFATFFAFGSLSYAQILPVSSELAATTASFIAVMLLVAAVGKSAQIPLYVWLPDAMAGPTPVSALIHAATMVTGGVYLLSRMSPVIAASQDWVPMLIAVVGAATAFFAATIATSQYDIKKVLAFSTVSQIGYMFLAVGVGAYWAAIFHMITHAFFKALLFLGAGSVIHAMRDEQDMRRMGALRHVMPVTALTFIVGWLAIAGVPPFSGFWSKDEILAYALQVNPVLYVVGLAAALLTAYYMARQVFMVFYGDARWRPSMDAEMDNKMDNAASQGAEGEPEPHESPWTMTVPLVVLAVLATFGGLLNLPFPDSAHFLSTWLDPSFVFSDQTKLEWSDAALVGLLALSALVALAGIGIAAAVHLKGRIDARRLEPAVLQHGWYVDSSISKFVDGPGRAGFEAISTFDRVVVDGAVNDVGRATRRGAALMRYTQSGYLRAYALMIAVGTVLLVAYVLTRVLAFS